MAGFELMEICLILPPEYWDKGCAPLCLAFKNTALAAREKVTTGHDMLG